MQQMKEMWVQFLGCEALEKEVATHCSILAWRIPWAEEPGRLQSMGSQIVRHNWSDLARTHIRKYSKSIGWKSARSLLEELFLLLKRKIQGRDSFCQFSQYLFLGAIPGAASASKQGSLGSNRNWELQNRRRKQFALLSCWLIQAWASPSSELTVRRNDNYPYSLSQCELESSAACSWKHTNSKYCQYTSHILWQKNVF